MAIRTIEIMCIPCVKCDRVKKMIMNIITMIEQQNKTKIVYNFTHTPHIRDISKFGLNPSQTPAVIINGQVEVSGQVEQKVLKNRLEAINKF